MKLIFDYFIAGTPAPQPRPRTFINKAGRSQTISNSSNRIKQWKSELSAGFLQLKASEPHLHNITGALSLSLVFYMPQPKKGKKDALCHLNKPDLDNLTKAVKDVMEDCEIIMNDSQIWQYVEPFKKRWAVKGLGLNPGVHIRLFSED